MLRPLSPTVTLPSAPRRAATPSTPTTHDARDARGRQATPYWQPYLAGIALGLVLLASFVTVGRGLGASGAFTRVVAEGTRVAAPAHAARSVYWRAALGEEMEPRLRNWLVVEVLGIALGGALSAALAGRLGRAVDRGPRLAPRPRLALAAAGGTLMGFGARLARGCTSGLALTGGALLGVSGWVFMLALFAGGYAAAYFARRAWT